MSSTSTSIDTPTTSNIESSPQHENQQAIKVVSGEVMKNEEENDIHHQTTTAIEQNTVLPKNKMITLISSDNVAFTVPRNAALLSELIANIIHIDHEDDCDDDENDKNDDNETNTSIQNTAMTTTKTTTNNDTQESEGYKMERVHSKTLEKVIEFMNYYYIHPMQPIPDIVLSTFIENIPQEWYRNYCSLETMNVQLLFSIREAADYLSIKPLINLTNVWLTFQVIGKSTYEIHELLNIPHISNDENDETRKQIHNDHAWALEPLSVVIPKRYQQQPKIGAQQHLK